ncbi:uncharacterized protein LOC126144708 [Schistocerca cancellata]|uniref:uncharacterized protein LOC126144708 n=1 Tax=Schistocerca cancellata TaxID=274614 RepID=UPI002118E3C1|nr:uncharacterized protein LOC126144708 [Schistocerca cancellata]
MKSSNKTKSMRKAMQDLMGKKTTHKNIVISHYGKNVTDPRALANSINSYYTNVAGKLGKIWNPTNTTWEKLLSIEINNISMFLSPISPTELLNTINSLKRNYSTGIDNIPDYTGKNSKTNTFAFIGHMQFILIMWCLPSATENGKRFSKITEKVFLLKLTTFFGKNSIISGCQHDFRPQRSIETATYSLINHVLNPVDNHRNISGLCLDLTKAFDVIDHAVFLRKLEWYGVRGVLNQWIISYLEYRSVVAEIKYMEGNELQEPCGLTHCVPQGPF